MLPDNFTELFQQATGHAPYDYQRALGERVDTPAVISVPTGAGKTQAVLCAWLHQRRNLGCSPRRLVYALPMRTLVEQTRDVALSVSSRLGLDVELPIDVLMGGEEVRAWREHPEEDAILIGTIDMLLSRALGRGYAESRFAWPVSMGLLNTDCRWIFDEVQLMGPAQATSAQLEGLRRALGGRGCQTTWLSATVDEKSLLTVDHAVLGERMSLSSGDREGALATRLNARKVLHRLDLEAVTTAQRPARIAAALLERHGVGTRSLCVVNRVDTAQAVYRRLLSALRKHDRPPRLVLLHSRFRPPDRAAAMARGLADVEADGPGTIVVATQVVEAGVDISSALLATETAPFSSIIQRLGRCNRAGELTEADVLWLDTGATSPRSAPPYGEADLSATRVALLDLVGQSLDPTALEEIAVPELRSRRTVLRRRDLIDLFDTTPDLSGADIDVAPFIRDDDDRSASVCIRDVVDVSRRELPGEEQGAPHPDELISVSLGAIGEKRTTWTLDHVDGTWVRRRPPPGAMAIVAASMGGYDVVLGWTGDGQDMPSALEVGGDPPDFVGGDPGSRARSWQKLGDHLDAVASDAVALARAVSLDDSETKALVAAAALHDVGKAHPVFQHTLMAGVPEEDRGDYANDLWAKSAVTGGRHRRRAFRHELVSVLMLLDGSLALDDAALTRYLIGAHHGRVRLTIRPAPEEQRPSGAAPDARFALGVVDGDVTPPVTTALGTIPAVALDLNCMELGAEPFSWTHAACVLRDELGPLRLVYLEAMLRIADWRASANA